MDVRSEDAIAESHPKTADSQYFERPGLSKIKDLVERFRVCWEVHPEQALIRKEIRKIGFSLELYGTHEPGTDHVCPGCCHCQRVQAALKEIAAWILPRERRASIYEVDVDFQSLTYSRERGDRPDVRVIIQILHRNNWDQPIDGCEERCLKDMEQALDELGACKGAWKPRWCGPLTRKEGPIDGR